MYMHVHCMYIHGYADEWDLKYSVHVHVGAYFTSNYVVATVPFVAYVLLLHIHVMYNVHVHVHVCTCMNSLCTMLYTVVMLVCSKVCGINILSNNDNTFHSHLNFIHFFPKLLCFN